nr:hypothetical protein [Treponema sp.]
YRGFVRLIPASFAISLLAIPFVSAQMMGEPEFGTVKDEEEANLIASYIVDGKSSKDMQTLKSKDLESSNADESVLLAKNGGKIAFINGKLRKLSGDVTNVGQSNFYGLNAAVVASSASSIVLQNAEIESSAEGANAVFATGKGSLINASNIKIRTSADSSRGLDATYGASITAKNVDIATKGAHCAAFATDRGEGSIFVDGGVARTEGEGSPVIYSTGNITVKNIEGNASTSEIAVIEGKNSISIDNCKLSGAGSQGIMLYQSFSGDANIGTSVFTAKNCNLSTSSKGPFFYVTNTKAKIDISNSDINYGSNVLIKSSGNNSERGWGKVGANGGELTFIASNQKLSGDIICDGISSISLFFNDGTDYTGTINASSGAVDLSLSKKASVTLTADSYVDLLSDDNKKFTNINSNGYTLYYNKDSVGNKALKGKTYKLPGGGKLVGTSMERKASVYPVRNDEKKEQPAMVTLKGQIKLYASSPNVAVGFVTDDGKEYTLEVMPEPKMMNEGGDDKKRMPPKDGMPPMGGGMPPKDGMASKNAMPPMGGEKAIMVKLEDLEKLVGEKLEIKGFISSFDMPGMNNVKGNTLKDGIFIVRSYTKL